jgi:type VI secretion system secreted protein Hcp
MAVNAYLVIDSIPGPSTSKTNAIDILSFSFGASNTAVLGAGSSGGEARAGRADFSNLSIMKVLDKTSPLLFDACVNGVFLKKVEILYDKPVGNKPTDYFTILLDDSLITSVQLSGSNENPMESVSFAFSKVKVSYNPEEDGAMKGFIDKGFDVLKLEKW